MPLTDYKRLTIIRMIGRREYEERKELSVIQSIIFILMALGTFLAAG